MKVALLKKFFRLACRLLKFKSCKNFLISKPPENEDYLFLMNKVQLAEKQKLYHYLENEDRDKNVNEVRENYLKLISMHSKEEESTKKEIENSKDDILIVNENSVAAENNNPGGLSHKDSVYSSQSWENGTHKKNEFENLKNLFKPINSMKGYNTMNEKVDKNANCQQENFYKKDSIQEYEEDLNKISIPSNSIDTDPKSLFGAPRSHLNISNLLKIEEEKVSEQINGDTNPDNNIVNFIKKKTTSTNFKNLAVRYDHLEKSPSNPKNTALKSINSENITNRENVENNQTSVNNEDLSHNIAVDRKNTVTHSLAHHLSQQLATQNNEHDMETDLGKLLEDNKKKDINVQLILIDHLRWGQYTYYCLCLLSSISERYLNPDYCEKICKYFVVFTRDEDAISRCRYPILTCVLAAEFLYRLGKINVKYQYKCHSIAEMMLQLGECLQGAIKDEEMLNYFLREQVDHHKRSSLEIIAENRFYDLLKDENVAAIVGKLWYGSGKDLSILKFCRISRILRSNIRHEHYKDVINNNINNKSFSFQYSQYTKNCSVRFLVDSFSTVMTTLLYQLIIYLYVHIKKSGTDPYSNTSFSILNYTANIIVYSINLNMVMYCIYVYKTNRKLKFSIGIFMDILMFFAVLCNFIKLPKILFGNVVVDSNSTNYQNLLDAVIYSVIILCAWMRVIGILMTTRSYGPFLRIIYLLLYTVMNFLLVFFAINTVFAQAFTLIFKPTNPDFQTFFSSWTALFMTSFGIQNYPNFSSNTTLGYSLLIAYTTLTNVMLLNLIIAIINNLFQLFESKADAENRAVLVTTYERIKWDNEYGLLILLPAPFNVITFIFSLGLFWVNDDNRVWYNNLFSKISYICIAIINFVILIAICFIMYPFALLKSYLHSSYDGYTKFKFHDFPKMMISIFIRPFLLISYIGEDIINYWKLCYKNPIEEEKENIKTNVSKDVILAFRKILFDYRYKYKKKIISLEDLYVKLGLNRRKKHFSELNDKLHSKSISLNSFDGTNSDYSKDYINVDASPINTPNNAKLSLKITASILSENSVILDQNSSEYRDHAFRYLMDKVADKDKFIDIERTMYLLPSRVKYTPNFLKSLHFMNMRVILRGLKKYFFINAVNNPVYSFKKLQQLVYKILIKYKMIYQYLPDNVMNLMKIEYNQINKQEKFKKNHENLRKMEENDEISDYDDQGEFGQVPYQRHQSDKKNTNNLTDENATKTLTNYSEDKQSESASNSPVPLK